MTFLRFAVQLLLLYPLLVLGSLSALDRFSIFEQINLHQAYIDNNLTCDNAKLYASLYWPEGTFRVIDPNRDAKVAGDKGIRGIYDYAHSVFPLSQWRHSVGLFQISTEPIPNFPAPPVSASPQGYQRAFVYWHWRVDWKANTTGVVSTGSYSDVFEKRGQEWKLLAKVSRDDPNWPLYLFAPYITSQNETFLSSCGDTSL